MPYISKVCYVVVILNHLMSIGNIGQIQLILSPEAPESSNQYMQHIKD